LKDIAKELNVSLNNVKHLINQLVKTKCLIIANLNEEIINKILDSHLLDKFLERNSTNQTFLNSSLLKNFKTFKDNNTIMGDISFNQFYESFKQYGYKYRQIAYVRKIYRNISISHLKVFIDIYLYFILSPELFHLVFIDETSLCPSNFKAKRWQLRGQSNVIPSRLRYEKISIIGAMSDDNVIACQFIHSGINAKLFNYFVYQVVRKILSNGVCDKQIVVLLDNSSNHRDKELRKFCEKNNIVLLYNLPHKCELNPIEYLWEFIKRPLRQTVDYSK